MIRLDRRLPTFEFGLTRSAALSRRVARHSKSDAMRKLLAEQQFGVPLDDVVGDFAHALVPEAVVKLLRTVVKGRDTKENKSASRLVLFSKGKQLRSNAFTTCVFSNGNGRNVRRAAGDRETGNMIAAPPHRDQAGRSRG